MGGGGGGGRVATLRAVTFFACSIGAYTGTRKTREESEMDYVTDSMMMRVSLVIVGRVS